MLSLSEDGFLNTLSIQSSQCTSLPLLVKSFRRVEVEALRNPSHLKEVIEGGFSPEKLVDVCPEIYIGSRIRSEDIAPLIEIISRSRTLAVLKAPRFTICDALLPELVSAMLIDTHG